MNILEQILDVKRKEMEHVHPSVSLLDPFKTINLKDALSAPGISVIAEIKMKSPSEGEILTNANPVQIAKDYEAAGLLPYLYLRISNFLVDISIY